MVDVLESEVDDQSYELETCTEAHAAGLYENLAQHFRTAGFDVLTADWREACTVLQAMLRCVTTPLLPGLDSKTNLLQLELCELLVVKHKLLHLLMARMDDEMLFDPTNAIVELAGLNLKKTPKVSCLLWLNICVQYSLYFSCQILGDQAFTDMHTEARITFHLQRLGLSLLWMGPVPVEKRDAKYTAETPIALISQ
jgi:hypothetical protein